MVIEMGEFRTRLNKATHLHENGESPPPLRHLLTDLVEFFVDCRANAPFPGDLEGALRITEEAVAEMRVTG